MVLFNAPTTYLTTTYCFTHSKLAPTELLPSFRVTTSGSSPLTISVVIFAEP